MKLLLDEMGAPEIASQLRRRGHDVIAIAEQPKLRGMSDQAMFELAQRKGYAIVTDNVVDFIPLAALATLWGLKHVGLVLTTNWKYPRRASTPIRHMVIALDDLLSSDIALENDHYWL